MIKNKVGTCSIQKCLCLVAGTLHSARRMPTENMDTIVGDAVAGVFSMPFR